MLTKKNSTIVSFRVEKKDWEIFKQKCRESKKNHFELIRNMIIETGERAYKNEMPVVDNYRYSYDSRNNTIRFEGIDRDSNRSHVLAEYPQKFLETLLEDNINLAKNLIDIKNKHLKKRGRKVNKVKQ